MPAIVVATPQKNLPGIHHLLSHAWILADDKTTPHPNWTPLISRGAGLARRQGINWEW